MKPEDSSCSSLRIAIHSDIFYSELHFAPFNFTLNLTQFAMKSDDRFSSYSYLQLRTPLSNHVHFSRRSSLSTKKIGNFSSFSSGLTLILSCRNFSISSLASRYLYLGYEFCLLIIGAVVSPSLRPAHFRSSQFNPLNSPISYAGAS